MRDIKFRQWYNGEMWNMSEFYQGVGQIGWSTEHYVDLGMHDHEDGILMQYTGLKDKSGVEIYEGDIVARLNGYGEKIVCVVKYSSKAATYFLSEPSREGKGILFRFAGDVEVIGNIYENPELVEGK